MTGFSVWIDHINRWIWTRIGRSIQVSVESLCVFRMATGLFLLTAFLPAFGWMGEMPTAFFRPPTFSIAHFFSDFPGKYVLLLIDLIILASAVCITIGIRTRIACRVFVVLSLIGLSFTYSFGRINHSILIYCLLVCLSFSNWGTGLAILPDQKRESESDHKALTLLAFVLCFAFFSSGIEKALFWLNFHLDRSGTASWFYSGYYFFDRRFLLASSAIPMRFEVFKAMDFAAVALELSPLLMLLRSRRFWMWWLLLACVFHLMNTLFLNIMFLYNVPVYLAFCDLSPAYRSISAALKKTSMKILCGLGLLLIVILRLTNICHFRAAINVFFAAQDVERNLYVGLVSWSVAIAIFLFQLFRERHEASAPAINYRPKKTDI